MIKWLQPSHVGRAVRLKVTDIGYSTRLFFKLFWMLGQTLRRPRLLTEQLFFLGNYSLAIIAVSGAFVGFVLGLQGYYILQRYGSCPRRWS